MDKDDAGPFAVWSIIIGLFFFVIGCYKGCDEGTHSLKLEAVKTGNARWVADEYGAVQFEWIKNNGK